MVAVGVFILPEQILLVPRYLHSDLERKEPFIFAKIPSHWSSHWNVDHRGHQIAHCLCLCDSKLVYPFHYVFLLRTLCLEDSSAIQVHPDSNANHSILCRNVFGIQRVLSLGLSLDLRSSQFNLEHNLCPKFVAAVSCVLPQDVSRKKVKSALRYEPLSEMLHRIHSRFGCIGGGPWMNPYFVLK